MIWIALVIVAIGCFYWQFVRPLSFWKNKGIPYVKGYPIVGNYLGPVLGRLSFGEAIQCYYNALPNEKSVGVFVFNKPQLMIRDPQLLKQMFIKDFDHFTDHTKVFFTEGIDSIFDKNLFSLQGNEWRDMRATLSPAFTGVKMRGMFEVMNECGEQVYNHYYNEVKNSKDSHLEVELKDLFTRFTNDIIASTAFGIKCDSFKNNENEFYLMGREATIISTWRFLMVNFMPIIMKLFKQSVIPVRICNYFRNLVKQTTTIREREKIVRPDMLYLLMEAKKGALKVEEQKEENRGFAVADEYNAHHGKIKILDDDDVAAQAFIFFFAGFETVSTAMCFLAYELALNPDIQDRLHAEILDVLESNNGKLTYDILNKMKYLDMCISESLRKWPPAVLTDRFCTKPYTLDVNGKSVLLEKGTNLTIPIIGIHYDPQYYPNPDKFDPERFSDENKHNVDPMTYLPFGVGPRICIGSRFALMEVKIVIVHIVRNFEIILTKKSTVPPKMTKKSTNMSIEGGFNVGFKARIH